MVCQGNKTCACISLMYHPTNPHYYRSIGRFDRAGYLLSVATAIVLLLFCFDWSSQIKRQTSISSLLIRVSSSVLFYPSHNIVGICFCVKVYNIWPIILINNIKKITHVWYCYIRLNVFFYLVDHLNLVKESKTRKDVEKNLYF